MNLRLMATLLTVGLICGCAWTPGRDNPVDPASPYYEKPPQRNRAPVIDTVIVVTDCRLSEPNPLCSVDIVAAVSDSDRNVDYSLVLATIILDSTHTMTVGYMAYDPERNQFLITRSQNDFPNETLNDMVGRTVVVSVVDDSGATDVNSAIFPQPVLGPLLQITFPQGLPVVPDEIHGDTVRLSWEYWPVSQTHTFGASVYYKNIYMVWDTAGLMRTDTFVVVTRPLQPSEDESIFYTWYLTVTDSRGNRLTAQPGYFYYFPDTEPPAMLRPEDSKLE